MSLSEMTRDDTISASADAAAPPDPAVGDDAGPPAGAAVPARSRRPLWPWFAGAAAVVLALVVFASLYHVDYVVEAPGTALPVSSSISVEGAEAFPPDGQVNLTTVTISPDSITLIQYLAAQFDSAVEVLDRDEVFGTGTPEEVREFNRFLMQDSQEKAVRVALGYLGIDTFVPKGVLVYEVIEGTPASEALAAEDVIVAVDGMEVASIEALTGIVGTHQPGDVVELSIATSDESGQLGEPVQVDVELAENPDTGGPMVGVRADTFVVASDLPIDVEITTGEIGGPSAGLAMTLAVLDVLTPGELTGGANVAVTGTIGLDGSIGPIGGIEQKAHAVRRAGIDIFVVPADQVAEIGDVGADMTVIGVRTLDDAVTALGELGGDVDSLELTLDGAASGTASGGAAAAASSHQEA
jgi:PDZ domain-containing protein